MVLWVQVCAFVGGSHLASQHTRTSHVQFETPLVSPGVTVVSSRRRLGLRGLPPEKWLGVRGLDQCFLKLLEALYHR